MNWNCFLILIFSFYLSISSPYFSFGKTCKRRCFTRLIQISLMSWSSGVGYVIIFRHSTLSRAICSIKDALLEVRAILVVKVWRVSFEDHFFPFWLLGGVSYSIDNFIEFHVLMGYILSYRCLESWFVVLFCNLIILGLCLDWHCSIMLFLERKGYSSSKFPLAVQLTICIPELS